MASIYNKHGDFIGNVLPVDTMPSAESTNLVESGGVYKVIETDPDKSITTAITNLIDKSKVIAGSIDVNTGDITTSSTFHVTDFIEVDTSEVYLSPNCDRMGAYDDDKHFISLVNVSPDAKFGTGAVAFPAETRYVRLRIIENGVDGAIFVQAKYYNKNAIAETVYTGFAKEFEDAFPAGFSKYSSANDMLFTLGTNLFDYDNDFYQVTPGLASGMDRNNGDVTYGYALITNEEEITGNFTVTMDKYYPANYGQMIVSNKSFSIVAFYTEDKTFISAVYVDSARTFQGLVIPENCAYTRISFRGSPNTAGEINSLSDIKNIVVWTVPVVGSNDLVPSVLSPQPHLLIDGQAISANYLDKVVPTMEESQFLSAMKCMAIREVNKRDHAWRFGNFNMWIMANTKGWNMTKKMLMDYGVDFCGFEECVINESTSRYKGIAEFLHGWQFPSGYYDNWTDGAEKQIDKSFVSRFEVISSEKLWTTSDVSYLNCKVRLPRYMDVYNPSRVLSVYVVHFAIVQTPDKIADATELLQQISTDNSDFVVILGDTNDFGATPETKDYWVTLENGGFNPVLPYNIKTVTQDNGEGATEQEPDRWWKTRAIDQFFVSDNIDVVSYGIVNTKEEYAVEGVSGNNTDNEPALSDHDFVYCDLKFDYSRPRTIVPAT